MGKIKVGWIIHIFALLHALVALLCRVTGTEDELLLTILTMTMALLICMKKGFSIEFTASSIIIVNIIGYLLGNAGARIFSFVIESPLLIHATATALTTEILGWSIVAFSKLLNLDKEYPATKSPSYFNWIIVAMTAAFALRIGILFLLHSDLFSPGEMMTATTSFLSSSFAIIMMLCINIIYIRYSKSFNKSLNNLLQVALLGGFTLLSALLGAAISCTGLSFEITVESWREFWQIYFVALITQLGLYCIVYMINYAVTASNQMKEEKEKKHVAQFRYQKLKRQVNPHFLFNSLNVLDCLVCDEKTEQASTYIHKLASVYRYMIKSEDEEVVLLSDELTFVKMYTDLLQVRFPEGFEVVTDIKEEDKSRFVLPCSIQLLIENATKHNAFSSENPLVIMIQSNGSKVMVSNNISPKITSVQSTGLGQKYIRQQYLDLSGQSIHIEKNEKEYCVTLPLL